MFDCHFPSIGFTVFNDEWSEITGKENLAQFRI